MKKEEISFVRRMVKDYYDAVYRRAEELEVEMPVYEYIDFQNLWGRYRVYEYHGVEMRPPAELRDELRRIENELRYWSTISSEEEIN